LLVNEFIGHRSDAMTAVILRESGVLEVGWAKRSEPTDTLSVAVFERKVGTAQSAFAHPTIP
jgi:hypothetical protein